MKVSFVYAGKRGSALEAALALYELSKSLGFESQLILSSGLERRNKVSLVYPEARFFDFYSFSDLMRMKQELSGAVSFFTMLSPKLVPLYMLLKSKKIFYFHATYDYSFSKPTLYDVVMEKVSEFLMYKSDLVLATQHPLAWQLRLRLGIDAKVLHHPTYHPIKKSFFDEEKSISLPFKDYFLYFGGIDRVSKGTDVLIEAVNGSDIPVVLAGRGKKDYSNSKNILHINRWVSDAELFYLVKNSKAVVLPYLVSSQFSGCLAVAYRFGKPVIAPFCNSFQNYIKPARTGLFFEQGNSMDLKEKLEEFDHYKFDSKYIHELDSSLSSRTLAELSKILAEF